MEHISWSRNADGDCVVVGVLQTELGLTRRTTMDEARHSYLCSEGRTHTRYGWLRSTSLLNAVNNTTWKQAINHPHRQIWQKEPLQQRQVCKEIGTVLFANCCKRYCVFFGCSKAQTERAAHVSCGLTVTKQFVTVWLDGSVVPLKSLLLSGEPQRSVENVVFFMKHRSPCRKHQSDQLGMQCLPMHHYQ